MMKSIEKKEIINESSIDANNGKILQGLLALKIIKKRSINILS